MKIEAVYPYDDSELKKRMAEVKISCLRHMLKDCPQEKRQEIIDKIRKDTGIA